MGVWIKKQAYTGETNHLHKRHNKEMAHINFMNLNQDRFQIIQKIQGPVHDKVKSVWWTGDTFGS